MNKIDLYVILIHVHTLFFFLCVSLISLLLQYEVRGKDSSFYVDDSQAAEKLALVNKKVTTIEGYKV
jgi:hypothetical protein